MDHVAKQRRHARSQGDQLDDRQHGDDRADDLHDAIGNSGVQRLAAAGAQAKLEVGGADDAYEQEADQVADEVMGGAVAQPMRDAGGGAPEVQRAGGGEGFAANDEVSASIDGASGGQRLPDDVRGTMEAKTGASFDDVRVHDDAGAHDRTAAVGAHAFTHGSDIHFAKGAYDPGSRAGQHLLAHELTHVVQQAGGQEDGVQRKAISAAPASVQRKGLLSIISSLFKKKKTPTQEKEREISKDVVPSFEATGNNYEEGGQSKADPKAKEHYLNWARDNRHSAPILQDADFRYRGLMAALKRTATAALALLPDDTCGDQRDRVLLNEYPRDLLTGLLTECKQSAPDQVEELSLLAEVYRQSFDRAKAILIQTARDAAGGENAIINCPESAAKQLGDDSQLSYVGARMWGAFKRDCDKNGEGTADVVYGTYQDDKHVRAHHANQSKQQAQGKQEQQDTQSVQQEVQQESVTEPVKDEQQQEKVIDNFDWNDDGRRKRSDEDPDDLGKAVGEGLAKLQGRLRNEYSNHANYWGALDTFRRFQLEHKDACDKYYTSDWEEVDRGEQRLKALGARLAPEQMDITIQELLATGKAKVGDTSLVHKELVDRSVEAWKGGNLKKAQALMRKANHVGTFVYERDHSGVRQMIEHLENHVGKDAVTTQLGEVRQMMTEAETLAKEGDAGSYSEANQLLGQIATLVESLTNLANQQQIDSGESSVMA